MSQSEPNLTVVIPVHNAAPHLGACVESLLAQSYTDFELILVENGSSDDSRERCARYAAEHPGRIRTLTLDEASVSAARNAGIDNARGRFITFMDADDWAEKEFLAEFFRDPAPGPGTIVMQGILLDFSEAEPPGPNEAFFSYDDGALAIGDDPSAAVGQRFLQDGCSVCKLYHTETLRRLGIRFIEHLCSREDHLFFFTCISRMQSVVWRSGLYMHYMRRGRNTLSTRPMPACELVEAAERLDPSSRSWPNASASRTRHTSSPCGKTWSATRCYGPQTTSVSATAGASSEPLPPARSCSAQRPTRPAGIRC